MVFGTNQSLKDQNFCLQEERDYFQAKYLEQVSEIQALKDELAKSKKEVVRLRHELMTTRPQSPPQEPTLKPIAREIKEADDDEPENELERTASTFTEDDDDDNDNDKQEEDEDNRAPTTLYEEDAELRASAEKLLQWASYRQSYSRQSSLAESRSLATSPDPLLLDKDDEKKEPDDEDKDDQNYNRSSFASPQDELISDLSEEYTEDGEIDNDEEEEPKSSQNQGTAAKRMGGHLLDRFERAVTSL